MDTFPNPLTRDGFTELPDEVLMQMTPDHFEAYKELKEAFAVNTTAEDDLKAETALLQHSVNEQMRLKALLPRALSPEDRRGLLVKDMIESNRLARMN
jgi:hypothetical protein